MDLYSFEFCAGLRCSPNLDDEHEIKFEFGREASSYHVPEKCEFGSD